LAVGCGTEPDPTRVPDGAAIVYPLPFTEAGAMRIYTGFTRRERIVIRTDDQWRELWARSTDDDGMHLLPPVDFSREIVILAAMAPKPIGGYHVTIHSVYSDGGDYYVVVRETAPTEECTPPAVTAPVDVVRLERPAGRIFFVEQKGSHRCRQ
jgi:hypothetical protein